MSHDVASALTCWPATQRGATAVRVSSRTSFSGAHVYRVATAEEGSTTPRFALRRWPPGIAPPRLAFVHGVQRLLAARCPALVPTLQAAADGQFVVRQGRRLWELAQWMPGEADASVAAAPARVTAALATLAAMHRAAAEVTVLSATLGGGSLTSPPPIGPGSPSFQARVARLAELASWDSASLRQAARRRGVVEQEACDEAIALVEQRLTPAFAAAVRWQGVELPRQVRLGDARRDHFLFVGDVVTGVIDYGAVDVDSPAGDVARLLGEFAGGDATLWDAGLRAYQQVRSLTATERRAVDAFHLTGVVIAAARWLGWLFREPSQLPPQVRREDGLARLRQLTAMLRSLSIDGREL